MSCIVGLISGKDVYLGGDSAGVSGLDVTVRADEKVFRKGGMIFGFTTSFRMGQILRYCLEIPQQQGDQDDYTYLCSSFIDAVIKCLAEKGFARTKDGEKIGGSFLLGYKSSLYRIDPDFQVGRSAQCYESIGCGAYYAKGALFTLTHHFGKTAKRGAKENIEIALSAAAMHCAGVCKPFVVLRLHQPDLPM